MSDKIKVFKFGGASVKNAEAIENVANILEQYKNAPDLNVVDSRRSTTKVIGSRHPRLTV